MVVEAGKADDRESIREISSEVFDELGAYASLLDKFFQARGVFTYVARQDGRVVGFVMLGFVPWSGGSEQGAPWIGDVLAIAVRPEVQGRGIGSALMKEALELAGEMAEWRDVRRLQLTCAKDNERAQEFFRRFGFEITDHEHGTYSSGQKAVRMSRPYPL